MDIMTDTLLLSTKLKIPVPRRNYVVREALFNKLSLCCDMSVVFISGGAGTGKTTLLSSFIREKGLKNVGWLSLDGTHLNVLSFWHYFAAAVGMFLEDDGGFLSLLGANYDASQLENLLTLLINRLCSDEDYYLVLDDIHCIDDSALTGSLEFFLKAMPENLHLFMLSREEPPVYLGGLAVSGRLLYIDGSQLQLSTEEGAAFLKQTLGLTYSDEELIKLTAYSEGWIGGLQLAAAASVAGKGSGSLLQAGGGVAVEYLTREIFNALAPNEQDFLVRTGFLPYFNQKICDSLLESGAEAYSYSAMIERLVQKNLFIICIDEQNGVYRYHNILSEYLSRQFGSLPESSKKQLILKAAQAFEEIKDAEEALRLWCVAEEYTQVMRVAHTMQGSIECWPYLNRVPLSLLMEDADLAAQCFIYNLGSFDIVRCRELYKLFEQRYKDSDILRAMQFTEVYLKHENGCLPKYQTLTFRQINSLPFGPVAKAMLLVQNAASLTEHMQYEEADACVAEAIALCAGANGFVDFFALGQKAQICEELGRLNDSLECYEQAAKKFKTPSMMSVAGFNSLIGCAGVYMRRMELDNARVALESAQKLLEHQKGPVEIVEMTLTYHKAEIKFLSGDAKAGAGYVERILDEYNQFSTLTLARLIYELDCTGLLEPELSDRFLRELNAAEDYKSQPFMRLLRARLLFKRGQTTEAFAECEEVLVFARTHKNRLRLVEAGLLKVFMLAHQPESADTRREMNNLLREAVYYAYENRILMPFYLDKSTLLSPLYELQARASCKNGLNAAETAFLREIIALCADPAGPRPKEPEVLSAREVEVLSELAQGITNREIAEKLCISQATVKTHIISIFGKLGVSSRMLAVEEGRRRSII